MPRPNDVGVGVAVMIFNTLGQVLILKRAGAHRAGLWMLPGGPLDRADETTEAAAIREPLEEVGLVLKRALQRTWSTEDHPEIGCRTVTLYHTATPWDWTGEARILEPEKCSELRWVYRDQLPEDFFPNAREILLSIPDYMLFRNHADPLIAIGGREFDPRERVRTVKLFYRHDGGENYVIIGDRDQTWGKVHKYIKEQLEPDGFVVFRVEVLLQ